MTHTVEKLRIRKLRKVAKGKGGWVDQNLPARLRKFDVACPVKLYDEIVFIVGKMIPLESDDHDNTFFAQWADTRNFKKDMDSIISAGEGVDGGPVEMLFFKKHIFLYTYPPKQKQLLKLCGVEIED